MQLAIPSILPAREAVLRAQGITKRAKVSDRIDALLREALSTITTEVEPVGTMKEVSQKDFAYIFEGEGQNAPRNPVAEIFPKAESLALFAITLGEKISSQIEKLFEKNDFAFASILDSVASLAAENAVNAMEQEYAKHLAESQKQVDDIGVLAYSPGYCGWHISGQKRLFDTLKPKRIGISLNKSFLMTPLKSVSGVLIAGKKEIHAFKADYPFCRICQTHSCRNRMSTMPMASEGI